jgi:hypothetical protein
MVDEDDSGGGEESGGGGRGFLAFWSSLPAVLKGLAAVLTALVAVLGVWRSVRDDSEGAAPAPATEPVTVGATTQDTGTGTGDYARTPTGSVLAEGRLAMRDNDTANLRRERISVGDPDADLWLTGAGNPDSGIVYAPYGGLFSDPVEANDKAACVAALNARTRDRVPLAELEAGTTLCLKTHEGGIAALRIVSPVEIGSPELVFEYTLWA